MRMESGTKKSLAIFIMGCGISGMSALSAHAQWGWNPFSSKPESQVPQQQEKTSFFRSPFEMKSPLGVGGNQAPVAGQSTSNSARPISDTTRRAIVETSRQYPIKQRQAYIKSFAGLTDQQARERLQRYAAARSGQSRTRQTAQIQTRTPVSKTTQTRQPSRPQSYPNQYSSSQSRSLGQGNPWERAKLMNQRPDTNATSASYGQASPQPAIRTVSGSSASAPQNPFLRRQQGLELQGTANVAQPQNLPQQQAASRPFPQAAPQTREMTQTPQPGVASTGTGIRIRPAVSNEKKLPVIRPASNAIDTSHYRQQYQPQKSEVAPSPQPASSQVVEQAPAPVVQQVSSRQTMASTKAIDGPELTLLISRAEALAASSQPGPTPEAKQQHITRHVDLRLLYLLAGKQDRALIAIPGIEPHEQAFWTRTIWALSSYLDHQNYPNQSDRTTVALEQLRTAIQSLQGDAHLQIRTAVLCSDIESFGSYTRFEREEFTPGQEILIYSEIDNFKSEQTSKGQYRTVLKSAVRLIQAGPNGREVDRIEYNISEDLCHSHRTDFMQGYKYRLPQQLAPGAYLLQLVMEDQLSGKRANYSLNFLVR